MSCFPENCCCNAKSQAPLSALFTESKVSFISEVMLIGTSALKNCRMSWAFPPSWEFFFRFFTNPRQRCKASFDLGSLTLMINFCVSSACCDTRSDEVNMPKNSVCLAPKRRFSIVSFNLVWRMYLKTALNFRVRSVAVWAAILISSKYWANWPALKTGSKYSRVKLD